MDFRLTAEQTGFAQSLSELMAKADSVAAARAWAAGDHEPGLALWKRLAEQGVTALVLPEDDGGLGGTPVDLVVAFEVLGHQLAVGPWIESAALAPQAEGEMVTAAVPPLCAVRPGRRRGHACCTARSAHQRPLGRHHPAAVRGRATPSRSTTRRSTGPRSRAPPSCSAAASGCSPTRWSTSSSASSTAARSAPSRRSSTSSPTCGSPSTSPDRWCTARRCRWSRGPCPPPRSAAGDAAYLASRVALQVHGAIGYTAEFDLGCGSTGCVPWSARGAARRTTARIAWLDGTRLMHFARTEEQDELAAIVAVAAGQAQRQRAVRAAMESERGLRRVAVAGAVRAGRRGGAARPGGVRRLRGLARRDGRRPRGARAATSRPSPLLATAIATAALLAARADDAAEATCSRGSPPARWPPLVTGELVLDGATAAIVLAARDGDALEVLDGHRDRAVGVARPDHRDWVDSPVPATDCARRHRSRDVALGADLRAPGGRGAARPRHDGRLQQGAGAVRPADRLVPGAQAPDGRHARARRGVPVGLVGRDGGRGGVRPGADGGSAPRCSRGGRRWRAPTAPTPSTTWPRRPCSCTAASRSPGSTTPSWCSSARTR